MKKINGACMIEQVETDTSRGYAGHNFATVSAACDAFFRRRGFVSAFNAWKPKRKRPKPTKARQRKMKP